jgi:hypothetical protein
MQKKEGGQLLRAIQQQRGRCQSGECLVWIGKIALLIGALICFTAGAQAQTKITFNASGSGGDGALDAQADFTISNGQIEVKITNLLNPSTIVSIGQSVSDLKFTISNPPGTNGTNTATGQLVDVAKKGGSVTDVTGTPGRWISSTTGGFAITGDTILLEAIGHGSPTELILPSDGGGGYPKGNASLFVHSADTDGPATFILSLSGVTDSTTISNATFSFGTSPDTFLAGTPVAVTSEPSSMLLFGTGFLGIGFLVRKRLSPRAPC